MKRACLFIIMLIAIRTSATNYYINPHGSDTSDGLTTITAFKTLQHAADLTAPGDTVFAMTGIYINKDTGSNVLNIYNSGTPNSWIVYTNYPGDTPTIKLYSQWSGIQMQGADYIVISGFTVIGNNDSITISYALSQKNNTNNPATSGNGIGCSSEYGNSANKSHHITVRNCTVSKCGGAGIYSYNADYLRIENNIVFACGWYSPYGNSGISLYQNWNSDSSRNIKNYVTGNTCYRNEEYVPFISAGLITDGNGIIIDDSRNTQNNSVLGAYVGKTYVANNLVFNNGGRGIHCYSSDHVIVVNNTCYENCQSPSVRDGELTAFDTDSILFINNISSPADSVPPFLASSSTHLFVDHNLWASDSGLANPFGTNTLTNLPDFVLPSRNPLIEDFHLQVGSAAIHAGTHLYAPTVDKDGNARVAQDSIDIGCYQHNNLTGISNMLSENSLIIFPNPASGTISIQFKNDSLNLTQIDFYNLSGINLKTVNTFSNNEWTTVDISKFEVGAYFVALKLDKNQTLFKKFIKCN